MTNTRECSECRNGEHDNYTDDVRMYIVRDPETKKMRMRGYLCGDHVTAMIDDGYTVTEEKA